MRRAFNIISMLLVVATAAPDLFAEEEEKPKPQPPLEASLDPFITFPSVFAIKPADLNAIFKANSKNPDAPNPYFEWLTVDKDRAILKRRNRSGRPIHLTLLDGKVPIQEAIIDFKDGKFLGVTFSIFNRGDGGTISASDFKAQRDLIGRHLGKALKASPKRKEANLSKGILTDGWIWISSHGKAVLDHNEEAPSTTEFLRLRIARRDAKGTYDAATRERTGATVRLSDLPRNVKKSKDGVTFVGDIPMVDQGGKGYCVVASAQRLFEYYGIDCDMHQLAQLADSDPNRGTSLHSTMEELGAIDRRFKTRFSCLAIRGQGGGLHELEDEQYIGDHVPMEDFRDFIKKWTEDGVPLLWSLVVGMHQETPPLLAQGSGGHMRLIIGFDEKNDRVYFSDSWGAGHEYKYMDMGDAYQATTGVFLLKPIVR